ncbi:MAG: DMT family transporter [Pseudomonadota bacterium]
MNFDNLPGLTAIAASMAIFAGGFLAARFYFVAGGTPADVTILRYGTAAILLSPVAVFCFRSVGFRRSSALALFGGAPFGGLIFLGMTGAPIVHGAAIVPGVGLVAGTIGAALTLSEPLPPRKIAGLGLALSGLAVLTAPAALTAEEGGVSLWAELCYVSAGLLWAAFTVALRGWGISPLKGAAMASVYSLPMLLLAAPFLDLRMLDVAVSDTLAQAAYQGVVFAVLGILLYGFAVAKLGAGNAVMALPLLPAFAACFDFALFDAPLTLSFFIALGILSIGVILIGTARNR